MANPVLKNRYWAENIMRESRPHAFHPQNCGMREGAAVNTPWSSARLSSHAGGTLLDTARLRPGVAAGLAVSLRSYQMFSTGFAATQAAAAAYAAAPSASTAAKDRHATAEVTTTVPPPTPGGLLAAAGRTALLGGSGGGGEEETTQPPHPLGTPRHTPRSSRHSSCRTSTSRGFEASGGTGGGGHRPERKSGADCVKDR